MAEDPRDASLNEMSVPRVYASYRLPSPVSRLPAIQSPLATRSEIGRSTRSDPSPVSVTAVPRGS